MIEVRQDGHIHFVEISGNVTPLVSTQLLETMERVLDGEARSVIFDLHEMFYICSMGIGVLAKTMSRLKAVGGTLVLLNPTEQVRELLRILRLDQIVPIVDSDREARALLPEPDPLGGRV